MKKILSQVCPVCAEDYGIELSGIATKGICEICNGKHRKTPFVPKSVYLARIKEHQNFERKLEFGVFGLKFIQNNRSFKRK
jgi:hypothetical protein